MKPKLRPRYRAVAWLGVLAVLVQLVVPYFHQPQPAAASEFPWDISDFCLLSGQLPPGYGSDSGNSEPADPSERNTQACLVCKALQHAGSFIPLTAVPVLYRFETATRIHYASAAVAVSGRTACSAQPRAPPVLV